MPRVSSRSRSLDAESNHTHERVLPATGPLPEPDAVIERVTDMSTYTDRAEVLRFMEEPVDIMIHESTDPNAEPMVFCSVNGEGAGHKKLPWLPRGVKVTIKRKFVERLARAKRVSIRTPEVRDAYGNQTTSIRKSSALAYPFSVVHDPNPNGIPWLQRILAEA